MNGDDLAAFRAEVREVRRELEQLIAECDQLGRETGLLVDGCAGYPKGA